MYSGGVELLGCSSHFCLSILCPLGLSTYAHLLSGGDWCPWGAIAASPRGQQNERGPAWRWRQAVRKTYRTLMGREREKELGYMCRIQRQGCLWVGECKENYSWEENQQSHKPVYLICTHIAKMHSSSRFSCFSFSPQCSATYLNWPHISNLTSRLSCVH